MLPGDSKPQALITQCYADGSGWQGPLVQDQLSFGGYTADVYAVAKALNIKDGEQSAPFSGPCAALRCAVLWGHMMGCNTKHTD